MPDRKERGEKPRRARICRGMSKQVYKGCKWEIWDGTRGSIDNSSGGVQESESLSPHLPTRHHIVASRILTMSCRKWRVHVFLHLEGAFEKTALGHGQSRPRGRSRKRMSISNDKTSLALLRPPHPVERGVKFSITSQLHFSMLSGRDS